MALPRIPYGELCLCHLINKCLKKIKKKPHSFKNISFIFSFLYRSVRDGQFYSKAHLITAISSDCSGERRQARSAGECCFCCLPSTPADLCCLCVRGISFMCNCHRPGSQSSRGVESRSTLLIKTLLPERRWHWCSHVFNTRLWSMTLPWKLGETPF